MAAKERRHALDGASGCSYGDLLAGDLEDQRPEQVHRRKIIKPRARIEVRTAVDAPCDNGIRLAQVLLGAQELPTAAHGVGRRSRLAVSVSLVRERTVRRFRAASHWLTTSLLDAPHVIAGEDLIESDSFPWRDQGSARWFRRWGPPAPRGT